MNLRFQKAKFLKSAKILKSGFWKAKVLKTTKILKLVKLLKSRFWKAKILEVSQNLACTHVLERYIKGTVCFDHLPIKGERLMHGN